MWGCGPPTGGRWIRGRADLTPFYLVPGVVESVESIKLAYFAVRSAVHVSEMTHTSDWRADGHDLGRDLHFPQ